MEYEVRLRNHWWFDAGIVGLYFIGTRVKREKDYTNINLNYDSNRLLIKGKDENGIREFLEDCYKTLASLYWNVSTKTQKDNLDLVIYDKETQGFSLAPKRQATPMVKNLISGKSWKGKGIKYSEMDATLRAKTDEYLDKTKKKLWGSKELLLYSLPECQPGVKILPKENAKRQAACSICGKLTSNRKDTAQPAFLLFASKNAARSFHTQGNGISKICWECEFISKFTMDTINYNKSGDSLSVLLLNSPNLEHSINSQKKIGSSSVLRGIDEDFFYKNIGFDKNGLINKARMSYELLWAYFVDTYFTLKSNIITEGVDEQDFFSQLMEDVLSSPIEIVILVLNEKGQTFITKELIVYNDISYAYRLLEYFLVHDVDIHKIYNSLYETDNKGNLKPSRNNILKKVLNKHCIVSDIEAITFRKVYDSKNKFINVSNIIKFLTEYYLIIKEDIMTREQIEVAVNLGKQIVYQPYMTSGQDKEVLKKIKGDLFALRKTRTVTDFITQLNTLQFRYGISVSRLILEGILNEVPFEDFKGYCIMGALNNFNYYNSTKKRKGDSKND